jgi:hypothetical protein
VPSGAGTLPAGANRGSFSHLKIRFAFIEYRRATCATETPGVSVCSQIERFSSSDQTRFFRPFVCAAYAPLIFGLCSAVLLLERRSMSSLGSPGRGHCEAIAGLA